MENFFSENSLKNLKENCDCITYLSLLCWFQEHILPIPKGPGKQPHPNSKDELTGKLHLKLQLFQLAGRMPQLQSKQGQRKLSPSWSSPRFVIASVVKRKLQRSSVLVLLIHLCLLSSIFNFFLESWLILKHKSRSSRDKFGGSNWPRLLLDWKSRNLFERSQGR